MLYSQYTFKIVMTAQEKEYRAYFQRQRLLRELRYRCRSAAATFWQRLTGTAPRTC